MFKSIAHYTNIELIWCCLSDGFQSTDADEAKRPEIIYGTPTENSGFKFHHVVGKSLLTRSNWKLFPPCFQVDYLNKLGQFPFMINNLDRRFLLI